MPRSPLSSDQILEQLRARRRKLIESIPPNVWREYRTLTNSIRWIELVEARSPLREAISEPSAIDLNAKIQFMEAEFRKRWSNEKLRLIVNLSPLEPVAINEDVVGIALHHLTENALDAIREEGTIRIETAMTDDNPRTAVLMVSDDGVGMTEKVKARIFEPAFSTKDKSGGKLHFLKTMLHVNGADINCSSEVGKGTKFTVTLPCSKSKAMPARIPLSVHKQRLIEFLAKNGESTRGDIIAGTGIPAGSLSELLRGEEFVQADRGFWNLRETVEDELAIGAVVMEEKYGIGTVSEIEGKGALKRVKIRFPSFGEKMFLASKVKLRIMKKPRETSQE